LYVKVGLEGGEALHPGSYLLLAHARSSELVLAREHELDVIRREGHQETGLTGDSLLVSVADHAPYEPSVHEQTS
jgi:hypothetical protein